MKEETERMRLENDRLQKQSRDAEEQLRIQKEREEANRKERDDL